MQGLPKAYQSLMKENAILKQKIQVLEVLKEENMQVMEALQKSEERFRAIADYTYDWENWVGLDGKTIWTNPAVYRSTGYTVDEYLGLKDAFLHIVDESHREEIKQSCEAALKGKSSNDVEFRILCKDGRIRWAAVSCQPIYADDGTALGYRSSVRDISERKHAEEALGEERKKLQTALAEIKTLRGIVPICANCKKIRDDKGFWTQVESYVSKHTEAEFSHGICPDCVKKLYPDFLIKPAIKHDH